MNRIEELLAFDPDAMGSWSVRDLQSETRALQAEVERLWAEREGWLNTFDPEGRNIVSAMANAQSLQAEVARLRKLAKSLRKCTDWGMVEAVADKMLKVTV